MRFWTSDTRHVGDLQAFLRIFFPREEIHLESEPEQSDIRLHHQGRQIRVAVLHHGLWHEKEGEGDAFDARGLLLDILTGLGHPKPPWGVLMGIRPTKLVFKMIDRGYSREGILKELAGKYRLDPEKARLLLEVCEAEKDVVKGPCGIQVYIGIPFCPSRCSYCSFASYDAGGSRELLDSYLEVLLKEIDAFKEAFRSADTIYIGGGTPTVLNEEQLERLLSHVAALAPPELAEFTVEAGRPETITPGKLEAMRRHGVDRISVNPQTFNEATLAAIGRRHGAEEIYKAYRLARSYGFKTINMDIIAGLPGETTEDAERTMDALEALKPDHVTVHTLAIKRAAALNEADRPNALVEADRTAPMLGVIYGRLAKAGYRPYYLYRQKQMLGQLENVGFESNGRPCLYNIHMIEETGPVLAFGAGTVSKQVAGGRIRRLDNPKNVHVYMDRIDDLINKKKQLYANQ